MDKQARINALQAKIAVLEQEKEQIEQWGETLCSLESFTPAEKIEVFDRLYWQSREYLQEFVEKGREPKDGEGYLYEAVLEEMLGPGVWKIVNAIVG